MVGRRGAGVGSLGVVLATLALSACGGLSDGLFGSETDTESAHAVFLTQSDCPYVVTNQRRDQFAVLAARGGYDPRQGDLLVGDLRNGEIGLEIVPFGAEAIARAATFEVAGHGLSLAEAQALYYGFCPLPAEAIPPGTPGLPLAPEDAPADSLPGTTGVF